MKRADSVDEYIAGYPKEVQKLLKEVRKIVKKAAPGAREVISYAMPAIEQNGIVVYFGAHTNHIGLYPKASGMNAFTNEFSGYKTSKGAVQFPLDKPMPADLITRVVKFNLEKNLAKAKLKKI